nr:unnamed protein product [Callosobruchus chinensis]
MLQKEGKVGKMSSRTGNADELVVTKVKAEENFILDSKVKQWKSLSAGLVCYTVGYFDSNITVLVSTPNLTVNGFNIYNFSIDVKRTPTDIELLNIRINGTTETLVIASFSESPQIVWYWMKKNDLKTFKSWHFESKEVVLLKVFKIRGQHTISFVSRDNNETLLSLYGFVHSIILDEPTNTIAFNNIRDSYFISVPQTRSNFVQVYILSESGLHPYRRIQSNNVRSVTSFEIIFRSFVAVDGQSAGIFEFLERDIVRRNVTNSNLYGIRYWLPVPVDTLRDEVILFAEREVDHGTHKAFVVEIITYNGVRFEEHEDVACHHFGEKTNWLECLSATEGMLGSSYVVAGDLIGLIVPRIQEEKALLFTVYVTIRTIDNPKKKDMEYYRKLRRDLERNASVMVCFFFLKEDKTPKRWFESNN